MTNILKSATRVSHFMKKVRARALDTERSVLEAYVASHRRRIERANRKALSKLKTSDTVDPDSPVFKWPALTRKKGRVADASERHDFYLYGWDK